jgi:CheY-like chemotaxis protein
MIYLLYPLWTTLEKLRSLPATASIPVIFCTAKAQRHEVEHFHSLGAAGVIAKPFDPMTLHDEVRRILGEE